MISSVRRQTKKLDVFVTDRSVVPGSNRQFSINVVAVDRPKLLQDITEAVLSIGEIADTDAMTTKDGIAFDNFLVNVPDDKDMDKKYIKANLLPVLESKMCAREAGLQSVKSLPVMQAHALKALNSPRTEEGCAPNGDQNFTHKLRRSYEGLDDNVYSSGSLLRALGIPSPKTGTMYPAASFSESEKRSSQLSSTTVSSSLQISQSTTTKAPDKQPTVEFEGVKFISQIQAGVFDAMYKNTRVAAKVLQEKDTHFATETELLIVTSCTHPNIVTFIESIRSGPSYCMLFEFMDGGALTSFFKPDKKIGFLRVSEDISKGMAYLHSKNIIHRDLKSSNVLLDEMGNAKVTDFGVSKLAPEGHIEGIEMTAEVGTYHYMAPEVIQRKPYTSKVDMYAFGIIMWEMAHKTHVWKDMTPMQAAYGVVSGNRPDMSTKIPAGIVDIIKKCWDEDPEHRPHFSHLNSEVSFCYLLSMIVKAPCTI
jgi:hypothetical protein